MSIKFYANQIEREREREQKRNSCCFALALDPSFVVVLKDMHIDVLFRVGLQILQ
jgi:hypothetical protein